MCQQPLTHSQPTDTPKHQQPQKTATPTPEPPAKHPPTPLCASHHSHIAAQRIFPNDNNRRKQPIPHPHHQPSTPATSQCVSSHSHITAKTTIKNTSHPYKTAMCNQPLTHSRAAEALNTVHPQDYDVAVQEAQPKPKAKSQAPQQD